MLLIVLAVLLLAAPSRAEHIAGLVAVLLGSVGVAGGVYWGVMLRSADRLLSSEPHRMLMDRGVRVGPKVGAWKTRLRTLAGESQMLGSYQLASFAMRRASEAPCLVYGPDTPGGVVVVSMGDYTLIGSAERQPRPGR